MFRARSTICTGSPMSSTKTSPRPPIAPAWTTSDDRLGDRHEVARHLRVRDRDRAAPLDLAAEDRDHAARRAEHVAEAHGDEPRRRRRRGAPYDLDDPLAERLRLAHHRLRVDAPCRSRRARSARRRTRPRPRRRCCVAEHVVAHRLERVRLHQRHVLVRGGVEDDARAGSARRPGASSSRLPDVGEHRHAGAGSRARRRARARSRRARVSAWSTRTSRVGADARDLAAELGADRAAGAGDEHGLAGEVRRRSTSRSTSTGSRPSTSSTCDRADLAGEVEVAGDQLVQARQRLHRHALARARSRRSAARTSPDADGIAISTSSGRLLAEDVAAARRSSRARGRRAGGGSSCAGRRRRGRSACSRATGCAASRGAISWPASPAPTTSTSLPRATIEPRRRALDERAREQARRRRRTRAGAASR